jgi:hypothetical protein
MTKIGRPPLESEASTKRIQVRVTPAQRLEMTRVATENQTDVSGVMREAINEYVSDYREGRRPFRRRKR